MTINERTKVTLAGLRQFFKDLGYLRSDLWNQERCIMKLSKIKELYGEDEVRPKSLTVGSQILFDAIKNNKTIELMVNDLETIDITPPK
jgi:hypothetical protein